MTNKVKTLCMAIACLCLMGCDFGGINRPSAPGSGVPAPEFYIFTFENRVWGIERVKGKAVVVNFWASWCQYCKKEARDHEDAYKTFKDKGVEFVSIVLNDNESAARDFVDKYGISYPSGMDADGSIGRKYNAAIPSTYIINKDGVITYVMIGLISRSELFDEIKKVAAKKGIRDYF